MAAFRSFLGKSSIFSRYAHSRQILKRNFLSEAYKCEGAWKERLNSPLLSKVNLSSLYGDIDHSFVHYARASPIDIDIFVNCIEDSEMVWELEDMLFKLRLSPDTHEMHPSTPHAVIRFLLNHRKREVLLRVLRLKSGFGIFPDKYTSNIMMDTFLKEKDYTAAARVAVEEMLQENYEEPLTLQLALYSCHMYLRNPGEWYAKGEIPEPEPEPKEVVKIRVKYIRNPFFDDHFDIVDPKKLLGKTFSSFGKVLGGRIGDCYILLGYTLHGKWKEALEVSKSIEKPPREILTFMKNHIKEQTAENINTDLELLSQSLKKLEGSATDEDLIVKLETIIKNTYLTVETKHIQELTQLFKDWEQLRLSALRAVQKKEEEEKLMKSIVERKEELIIEERELFFFENEEQLRLKVEERDEIKKKILELKENWLPISRMHTLMEDKIPKDPPHRKLKNEE